ncbi:sickle tail protein-like [Esox lucius]|nr:sickle tail protein-like [Esox lucius]
MGNMGDCRNQQVVPGSPGSRAPLCVSDDGGLSPDLPDEEGPPRPESIGFMMITSSRVQALSTKEYQEILSSSNGSEVQTVKVGNDSTGFRQKEHCGTDREPVIIIFDEPMDIQSAYKRMSTIFECEEELERMLRQESIDEDIEEVEEAETEKNVPQVERSTDLRQPNRTESCASGRDHAPPGMEQQKSAPGSPLQEQSKMEPPNGSKPETKKKFKFKFPKNKLAAISQALRTGTKTGKKTLQVVACEDEEEGRGEGEAHTKANKKFDSSSKPRTDSGQDVGVKNSPSPRTLNRSKSKRRTEEICKNACGSINNLEENIQKLEITVDNMSPAESTTESSGQSPSAVKPKREREGSPSKRPAPPQVSKSLKPPQSKKSKPQLPQITGPSTTGSSKKQLTGPSTTSSSRKQVSL